MPEENLVETSAGTESVDSSISTETAAVPASNPDAVVEQDAGSQSDVAEEFVIPDDVATEIDAQIAEAQAKADETQTPLVQHLRKALASKNIENRELSKKTPEMSESERYAIELYNDLTAFDPEQGIPTSKQFAEKLVAKDKDLAVQAGWDLLRQPIGDDGMTVGHALMEKMGLDPTRLDDYRKFTRGEIKGEAFGLVDIPPQVPREYAEAFKSLSKVNRDNIAYQLERHGEDGAYPDPEEVQAALEVLASKQGKLESDKATTENTRIQKENRERETAEAVERNTLDTFNQFAESFKETPTYTAATISSNPQFDSGVKDIVSLAVIGLGYPDTVFGQQCQKFFTSLGVQIDSSELNKAVAAITGNIEGSVKADKAGYASAKTEADERVNSAKSRASGLRNKIFTDAIAVLAGTLQGVSQANADKINANGGIPVVQGTNGAISNGEQKVNTLDLVKQIAAQAQQTN